MPRTGRRLRRGVFQSVADLEQAIAHYIREHNATSNPFAWIELADSILAKLNRLPEVNELWPELGDGGVREAAYRGG